MIRIDTDDGQAAAPEVPTLPSPKRAPVTTSALLEVDNLASREPADVNSPLAARVEELERAIMGLSRRCKFLQWGGITGVVLAGILGVSSSMIFREKRPEKASSDRLVLNTVEARNFILRGDDEKKRGQWMTLGDEASFLLFAPNMKQHVSLFAKGSAFGVQLTDDAAVRGGFQVEPSGPRLTLTDTSETVRLDLTVKNDGWSRLNVLGIGESGVNLSASKEGTNIAIFDTEPFEDGGKCPRFGVTLDAERDISMILKGHPKHIGSMMGQFSKEGDSSLIVLDRNGQLVTPKGP